MHEDEQGAKVVRRFNTAGLARLDRRLDRLDGAAGTLVVFDRRPDAPAIALRTRITSAATPEGRNITLLDA